MAIKTLPARTWNNDYATAMNTVKQTIQLRGKFVSQQSAFGISNFNDGSDINIVVRDECKLLYFPGRAEILVRGNNAK